MTSQLIDRRRTVSVVGEALVDLVPSEDKLSYIARPGGSPYNVAVGLARLGVPTSLMARLADNIFGRLLRDQAHREGIDLTLAPVAHEATTVAVVSLDGDRQASYDFYVQGTADWQWTAEELQHLPDQTAILHFGSIASWTPPGQAHIETLARQTHDRGDVLVSYDPNVRPLLLEQHADGRATIERCLGYSHLTKVSREDLDWLYPDQSVEQSVELWLSRGPQLIIVTDGSNGATAFPRAGRPVHRAGVVVEVVDTVGAGDSFSSGLLAALLRSGITNLGELRRATADDLTAALDDAVHASALTCTRIGAEPPSRAALARQLM